MQPAKNKKPTLKPFQSIALDALTDLPVDPTWTNDDIVAIKGLLNVVKGNRRIREDSAVKALPKAVQPIYKQYLDARFRDYKATMPKVRDPNSVLGDALRGALKSKDVKVSDFPKYVPKKKARKRK